jgi:hypothetical protein
VARPLPDALLRLQCTWPCHPDPYWEPYLSNGHVRAFGWDRDGQLGGGRVDRDVPEIIARICNGDILTKPACRWIMPPC